jgi:hypothetical protein
VISGLQKARRRIKWTTGRAARRDLGLLLYVLPLSKDEVLISLVQEKQVVIPFLFFGLWRDLWTLMRLSMKFRGEGRWM